MGYAIDRRQWLKTSALAVAGLMAGPRLEIPNKEASVCRDARETDTIIRLNSNESPFGISQYAREAITGSIDLSNRYPHRLYSRLKEIIAEREGITQDHILLGAGSTEVMVTLIHFMKTNGEILVADPTYFDFIFYATTSERALKEVRLNEKFEHDLDAMEKQISARTHLIYICNPNNPTGSITPKAKLRPFCVEASKKALVVVDEAYHEYVEDESYSSMIGLVEQGKNLIITRTFSKIFGLAGLRIGYGIAHPQIIKKLETLSRNFAPVSWLSLQAAIASYQDRPFIRATGEKNKRMRRYLSQELGKLGLKCIPSHTNFVLFQIGQNALELTRKLEEAKIFVRPFEFHGRQWLRVSCGTEKELQAFLASFSELI